MFGLLKKHACSIGIDTCNDSLRLVQLENNGKGILLIAGATERPPEDVKPGSSTWQRWAIETMQKLTSNSNFQGKEVDATEVRFQTIREEWNEYQLMDGTVLRMKAVVGEVFRVEDTYDNEGNPVYQVKSNNMLIVKSTDALKKGG